MLIINALIRHGGLNKAPLLVLLMGMLCIAERGYSATLVEVSTAVVEVPDQGQSTTQRAMREALSRVFVKMSGTASVLDNAQVRSAVRSPEQYLRSYSYSFDNGKTFYVAEFDDQRVSDILREQNLSIWESRRPETLFWLAVEDTSGRQLMGNTSSHLLKLAVDEEASYRGLPVEFPIIDEAADNSALVYDVWGRFGTRISTASLEYGADTIIAARLYPNVATDVTIITQDHSEVSAADSLNDSQVIDEEAERLLEEALSQEFTTSDVSSVDSGEAGNATTNGSELSSLDLLLDEILSEQDVDDASDEDTTGRQIPSFLEDIDYTNSGVQAFESEQPAPSGSAFSSEEFDYYAQRDTSGAFRFDFMIISQTGVVEGKIYGDTPEQMIRRFVNQYADDIAVQYTVLHAEDEIARASMSISVANIDSIEKYASIITYLSTFNLIESVVLTQQEGSVASFDLVLRGNAQDFVTTILLDSQLVPVNQNAQDEALQRAFYWNP